MEQTNLIETNLENKVRVMLVDDHSLMRNSLKMYLQNDPDIQVVAEASNGDEAVKLASKLIPDVIIMDIAMPKMNGLDATKKIKSIDRNIAILVLTVHSDIDYILKILEFGAAGYLTKNIRGEDLIHAVHLVASGESLFSKEVTRVITEQALHYPLKIAATSLNEKLSNREMEIFKLVAGGMSNKQIALKLEINLRTVKTHLCSIFTKLGVFSRTQAIIVGLKQGFVKLEEIN
jgi:two-component system, NarL family, response regulator LiaR